jgi:hypothetical protein
MVSPSRALAAESGIRVRRSNATTECEFVLAFNQIAQTGSNQDRQSRAKGRNRCWKIPLDEYIPHVSNPDLGIAAAASSGSLRCRSR